MVFRRYLLPIMAIAGLVGCMDRVERSGDPAADPVSPCEAYECVVSYQTSHANPITISSYKSQAEISMTAITRQGGSTLNPTLRAVIDVDQDRTSHAMVEGECVDVNDNLGVKVLDVEWKGRDGWDSSVTFCVVSDYNVEISQEFQ